MNHITKKSLLCTGISTIVISMFSTVAVAGTVVASSGNNTFRSLNTVHAVKQGQQTQALQQYITGEGTLKIRLANGCVVNMKRFQSLTIPKDIRTRKTCPAARNLYKASGKAAGKKAVVARTGSYAPLLLLGAAGVALAVHNDRQSSSSD